MATSKDLQSASPVERFVRCDLHQPTYKLSCDELKPDGFVDLPDWAQKKMQATLDRVARELPARLGIVRSPELERREYLRYCRECAEKQLRFLQGEAEKGHPPPVDFDEWRKRLFLPGTE